MKKINRVILFFVFFSFISCINETKKAEDNARLVSEKNEIISPGVLIIDYDSLRINGSILWLEDSNGILPDSICVKENGEVTSIKNIRAYYPDYSIIVLDSWPVDTFEKYKVIVDGKIRYLSNNVNLTKYVTWESFLYNTFLMTNKNNPLRQSIGDGEPTVSIDSYEDVSFVVEQVKGDWAKVKCNIDCEGCPDMLIVSGWLRWRNQGKLLVELYYSC